MKMLKTKRMHHIKRGVWKETFNSSRPYNGILKARGQRGEFQKCEGNFIRVYYIILKTSRIKMKILKTKACNIWKEGYEEKWIFNKSRAYNGIS